MWYWSAYVGPWRLLGCLCSVFPRVDETLMSQGYSAQTVQSLEDLFADSWCLVEEWPKGGIRSHFACSLNYFVTARITRTTWSPANWTERFPASSYTFNNADQSNYKSTITRSGDFKNVPLVPNKNKYLSEWNRQYTFLHRYAPILTPSRIVSVQASKTTAQNKICD